MLCTLQTWNLFGGSVVDTSRWFISTFSPLGFFSFQSAGISLLLAEEGCRFPSIHVFARCKHGTCSDEVRWSLWMVGRSRQLDEGAGRQKWECHDQLNCAICGRIYPVQRCMLCSYSYSIWCSPGCYRPVSYFIWCSPGCIRGDLILCSATYGEAPVVFRKRG